MPVHERGYTHWNPSGLRPQPPSLVIARRGLAAPLKRRWPLALFFFALIPAVVKGVFVFINARTGNLADMVLGAGWSSLSPAGFLVYLEWQRFFVFLITMILGAGLIARDRQDNGLSLYFSRPIGLADYLGGKLMVILGGYLAVTLLPSLLLCLYAYLIDPAATGLEVLLLTPLRLLAVTLFMGTGLSLVLMSLSSLATRTVLVVVWWAVFCLGGGVVGNLGGLALDIFQYLNFMGHWHNASTLLMDAPARLPIAPWISLLICLGLMAGSVLVLRQRVKPVEVVT